MYQILKHAYDFIRTNDEKYLYDKYMKNSNYALLNFIQKLNIPDDDNDSYKEGVLNTIKIWMEEESYKGHLKAEDIKAKKDLDKEEE